MALDNIMTQWDFGFKGEMIAPRGKVLLGETEGGVDPYHMLFGALASCFYATFLSIVQKKNIHFEKATVEVSGRKKEVGEVRTLEHVDLKLTVTHPSDTKQITQCAELGTRFCSIHETISRVASIKLEVCFQ